MKNTFYNYAMKTFLFVLFPLLKNGTFSDVFAEIYLGQKNCNYSK